MILYDRLQSYVDILVFLSVQICDNSKSQVPVFILRRIIFFLRRKIVSPKIVGWFSQVLSHPFCLIIIV